MIQETNVFYVDHVFSEDSEESYERINFEIIGGKFVNVKNKEEALAFKGTMPKIGKLQINANGDTAIAICNNKYCACKSVSETKVIVQKTGCEIDEETGEIGAKKDATPVGTVISFMGNHAPEGYSSCDGAKYKINEYSKLAELIKTEFGSYNYFGGDGTTTFSVPDLRGEFLRGTGTAIRNTGTGGNVGIHQDPTSFPSGYGTSGNSAHLFLPYNPNYMYGPKNYDNISSDSQKTSVFKYDVIEDQTYRGNVGMITTRPTNTAILYCIKY